MFPTIEAQTHIQTPPKWAVLERQLIDKMNAAGPEVMEKYTRPDGTLFWPTHPDFQSIDGLDDAYESFHNWSLFLHARWRRAIPNGCRYGIRCHHKRYDAIRHRSRLSNGGQRIPTRVRLVSPRRRELPLLYALYGGSVKPEAHRTRKTVCRILHE